MCSIFLPWLKKKSKNCLPKQCSRGKYTRPVILSGKLFYFRTFFFFSKNSPVLFPEENFLPWRFETINSNFFSLIFQSFKWSKFFWVFKSWRVAWYIKSLMIGLRTSSFRIGSLPQFFQCRSWALSLRPLNLKLGE